MEKEFKELQEYIDLIISTARLLNYNVTSSFTTTYIFKKDSYAPFMSFTLINDFNHVILATSLYKDQKEIVAYPEDNKIEHLQSLLEEL